MTNQTQLNNYFGTVWRENHYALANYQFSGPALVDRIQEGERVIDIGCGTNQFQGHIANLIGIDPAFPEANYQMTLEEFAASNSMLRFNVAFCLGSINFGTRENIENQISIITKLLRRKCGARIYWRCNPGRKDHPNTECEGIEFYPWTFEEHVRLADMFNFEVTEIEWDSNNRIFAEWVWRT